jgi:hypothetical protein
MAYLRRITKLASGNTSRYHVIGGPDGIINLDAGELIPYPEMREILKRSDGEIRGELEKRLELNSEEAKCMTELLIYERNRGKWEKPFDFENKYKKA